MQRHSFGHASVLKSAVLLLLLVSLCPQTSCKQQLRDRVNSCKVDLPEGTIDLWPLDALNRTGKPKFLDFAQIQIGGVSYALTYNPCTGFQCNTDQSAAVCANDIYKIGLHYDIGSQAGNVISMVNQTVQIQYTSTDKGQGRDFITVVSLFCTAAGSEDTVTNVDLTAANLLTYRLNSPYCCLIPRPRPSGWSPGDYLVLFFFLALIVYIIVFLMINRFAMKRNGLDLLPHREAWIYLALLVKDGCVFSVELVRGKIGSRAGYSEI